MLRRVHVGVGAIAGLAIAAFAGLSPAQSEPPQARPSEVITADTLIPSAKLLEDYRVMREVYEALHPGLYRSHTIESLEAEWKKLESEFSRDRSMADAFVAFSRTLATLKCGHAYTNFYNQSKAVKAAIITQAPRVPFHFRWIDRQMVITENRSQSAALAKGTIVRSINAVPAATVLDTLLTIARADGNNDRKRVRYLEVSGGDQYEAFDIYLPLLFPRTSSIFEFEVESAAGEVSTITVPGLTYEQRIEPMKDRAQRDEANEAVWDFTLEDSFATLTMPGWAVYNTTWDWQTWLNEKLDQAIAAKVPNMVIDLRGNEGGLDCGDPIIARLIERDLSEAINQRYVRADKVPDHLNRYLDTWDDSFRDVRTLVDACETPALVAHGKQQFYTIKQSPNDTPGVSVAAKTPRYTGKVYVLVDSVCSSATFRFASIVKREKLGTLIGEPTGGNQRGINGGAFFFLRLPNTRIEMDVPLIAGFPARDVPDAGIEPDILTPTTIESIRTGIDPAMQWVGVQIAK